MAYSRGASALAVAVALGEIEDTDISATRHARAAVGGLISGLSGTGAIYVSGGAEHQGPPGGGPVAAIAQLSTGED